MIKLKLKATGDEQSFSRHTWERSKHRAELWEVVDEGDPVMAIKLKEDGNHKELYYMDRDHAQKMIKPRADKYSLIEYDQVKEIKAKIPIDPDKINIEQKQKDAFVRQSEEDSPRPIQVSESIEPYLEKLSTQDKRHYDRTGQLPKDALIDQLDCEKLKQEAATKKENNQQDIDKQKQLIRSEFPEPDHDIERATTEHDKIIKSIGQKRKRLAKFSFPKIEFGLTRVKISIFSILILFICSGLSFQYARSIINIQYIDIAITWNERLTWIAVLVSSVIALTIALIQAHSKKH